MYTCVDLLEEPFASELETHTNEINVSQVSATLYKFMANAQAWYGFLAKMYTNSPVLDCHISRAPLFCVRSWFRFG